MANMKEVAKLANVSITTVYRVIHNNGYVKDKTKKNIEEAIKTLNYYPNNLGRSLNTNFVNIIAVIAPIGRGEIENEPYYVRILSGIESTLANSGIDILISTQRPVFSGDGYSLDYCKPFLERKADGVIILAGYLTAKDYQIIKERKIPTCLVSAVPNENVLDYVDVQNYDSFRVILNRIYSLGHRDIAFGGLIKESSSIQLRFSAYKDFLKEKELPFKEEFVFETSHSQRTGVNIIHGYKKLKQQPTAIAFSTDNFAVEAFIEATKQSIRIPDDLSITGFDGTTVGQFMVPSLATMEQPLFQMGEEAAKLLVERIYNRDKDFETVYFESKFRDGQSLTVPRKS